MKNEDPIICFGQQPCGIFPKRFLFAKIQTVRRLQLEIGGRIVFFYHDSDHDHRETNTILVNRRTKQTEILNFTVENRNQKCFAPLYRKMIASGWPKKTARILPNLVSKELVSLFVANEQRNVADFCLEMYCKMGLLHGIEIARSSDPAFRMKAVEVDTFFIDAEYEGEVVRARYRDGVCSLHRGGDRYYHFPAPSLDRRLISPTRDSRLQWMQSVIGCTHYVAGEGELAYLEKNDAPEVKFMKRDVIDRSNEAYVSDELGEVAL